MDSLAATLASRKKNPFGAPYPDIQLVHDYFNFQNRTYNTDSDFPGFMLGDPTYPPLDRQHADYYIYLPGHSGYMGGTTNSQFEGAKEDSITGH